MGAGGAEGAIDASNVLKPALSREKFSVLALPHWMNIENILKKTAPLKEGSKRLSLNLLQRRKPLKY